MLARLNYWHRPRHSLHHRDWGFDDGYTSMLPLNRMLARHQRIAGRWRVTGFVKIP